MLNKELLIRQGVTEEQEKNILKIHKKLEKLKKNIMYSPEKKEAKDILNTLRELEYKLQENWNFPKDDNYHYHWLDLPFCSCPKMDNRERIGTGFYIYNTKCPYHGFRDDN